MAFLTSPAIIKQVSKPNKFQLCTNELFYDGETNRVYLAWRGFISDNYTWLRSTRWDIRCAHIHDIACHYHQLVYVPGYYLETIIDNYIIETTNGDKFCKDIPAHMLRVEDCSKREANKLFGRMMKDADCPSIPWLVRAFYRIGVAFNLHWFFTGKEKIDKNNLYH